MRRSLTLKEREAMYEAQDGFCACGCGRAIYPDWCIAEHEWPVALGNAGKPDGLWHPDCANRKTNGTPATSYGSDKHEIAKSDRLEGDRLVRERADPRHLSKREQKVFQKALKRSTRKLGTGARLKSRPFQKPPAGHKHRWPKKRFGQ